MNEIHPSAVVSKDAVLGDGIHIGPYCVVGPRVRLGDGVRLLGHVFLDGHTTIEAGCTIFPFASIGTQTQDLKYKGGVTYVEIGARTTLREYVTVNSGTNEGDVTRVGSDCHIMAYSHIAHQCIVGDGVIISNAGTLAGHVIVEPRAVIGGLCGIHQFVRLGSMCITGGCSKVTKDVPPYVIADGNPALVYGLNTVALERNNVSAESRAALKKAFRILYRSSLATEAALDRIRADVPQCDEVRHLIEFVAASKRGITRGSREGDDPGGSRDHDKS